jgi:flagellar motor switch protein FliM
VSGESHDEQQARMCTRLRDAQIQLSVRLACATLDVRQLLALEPGDVISVELPERVSAEVDGVPLLEGGYGVLNGRYALKIERVMTALWPGGGDGEQ